MKPDAIEKMVEKYLEDMRRRKLQWKESPMEDIRSNIKAMNKALRWLAIVYNIAVAVLAIAFIILCLELGTRGG